MKSYLFACLLLFIVAMGQYANTFKHGYVFDDSEFITYNAQLGKGWAAIPYFFTHTYSTDKTDHKTYRPMVLSSFAVEQSIFGNSPMARHILHVIYFALLCCLLFSFLYRLLGKQYGMVFPFFATLLFALHPIHVEVVANLKNRDEMFVLLFGLSSLHAFLSYWRSDVGQQGGHIRAIGYGAGSITLLVLAFLSKTNAMTFIALYPLVAWYAAQEPTNVPAAMQWRKLVAFMAGLSAVLIGLKLSIHSLKLNEASDVLQVARSILGNPLSSPDITFLQRACTTVYVWGRNLYLLVVPYPLVYHTGYNYIPITGLSNLKVWLSLLACIGLAIWAWRDLPKRGIVGFGLMWYMISLSIYGQVIKLAPDIAADRFLFTPSAGFCVAVLGAIGLLLKIEWHKGWRAIAANMPFLGLFTIICVIYFCRTYSRNEVWKDNMTLFSNDMPLLKHSARPHAYLANELVMKYSRTNEQKKTERQELQNEAIGHYQRAIDIAPFSDELYLAYTRALLKMGKRDTSLQMARRATMVQPDSYHAAIAMSDALFDKEQYADAIPYLRRTLRQNPERDKSYELLAWSYFKQGSPDSAHTVLDSALSRFPNNGFFWREKGKMYYLKNDTISAVPLLLKADSLKPNDRETLHMLATSYATLGDTATAKQYANKFNKTLPTIYH